MGKDILAPAGEGAGAAATKPAPKRHAQRSMEIALGSFMLNVLGSTTRVWYECWMMF